MLKDRVKSLPSAASGGQRVSVARSAGSQYSKALSGYGLFEEESGGESV